MSTHENKGYPKPTNHHFQIRVFHLVFAWFFSLSKAASYYVLMLQFYVVVSAPNLWQKFSTINKAPISNNTEAVLKDHLSLEYDFYQFVRQRFYSIHRKALRLRALRKAWPEEYSDMGDITWTRGSNAWCGCSNQHVRTVSQWCHKHLMIVISHPCHKDLTLWGITWWQHCDLTLMCSYHISEWCMSNMHVNKLEKCYMEEYTSPTSKWIQITQGGTL